MTLTSSRMRKEHDLMLTPAAEGGETVAKVMEPVIAQAFVESIAMLESGMIVPQRVVRDRRLRPLRE